MFLAVVYKDYLIAGGKLQQSNLQLIMNSKAKPNYCKRWM